MLFSSFSWMRRFAPGFAIFSVALLIMFPLAACGGSSSSSTSSTSTGPVNLTYWAWIGGMDKQVALFNQAHPNIHVTVQNVGSGPVEYDKLFTAIKANNEPDVAEVEFQTLPQFETTGSLVDISKYGANSVKDQFPSWMWNQVILANGVYAIPQDGGPMVLYYREDIFKKYNLPVPTTWAQYADEAAKLHAADPKVYIGHFNPRQPGQFVGFIWQN
ncbi:MAG: extracellular solute-binding protein, partial [Chloroflexi bacterium]